MSNYEAMQKVKEMIVSSLSKKEGWKVYGFVPGRLDSMADYYDPAYWHGIATKNGFVLCVDVKEESKIPEAIYEHRGDSNKKPAISYDVVEKIKKLSQMTVEHGATIHEQKTAERMIEKIKKKAEVADDGSQFERVIVDYYPVYHANPNRNNWHVEKDGVIIAKGNRLSHFSEIYCEFMNEERINRIKECGMLTEQEFYNKNIHEVFTNGEVKYRISFDYYVLCNTRSEAEKRMKLIYNRNVELNKILTDYEDWLDKVDNICGGSIGKGAAYVYEEKEVKKTVKEIKPVIVTKENASIKIGQHFILLSKFNRGCSKGNVYEIFKISNDRVIAYKMNGKNTAVLMGNTPGNIFCNTIPKFMDYVDKSAISFCDLKEVETTKKQKKMVKTRVQGSTTRERYAKAE